MDVSSAGFPGPLRSDRDKEQERCKCVRAFCSLLQTFTYLSGLAFHSGPPSKFSVVTSQRPKISFSLESRMALRLSDAKTLKSDC